MDGICSSCPLLEEFTFEVQSSQPTVYPRVPKSLKDEEKFFHLTRLYIKFAPDSYRKFNEDMENEEDEEFIFDNEKFEHDAQTFQRFKKYLEEKCPKLRNKLIFILL